MEQKVQITMPATDAATFLAAMDMATALCERNPTHWNAGDHLMRLRQQLMEAYVNQVQ
jgi:hypothetical protein